MTTETESPQSVKTGKVVTREQAAELVKPEGGVKALERILMENKGEWTDPERDPMDSIIEQVLRADSPAAVLTPVDALQARDYVGVPLMLLGWQPNESDYDAGSPVYASLAVLMPGGEPNVMNCGHKKVLAQLVKLNEFNQYPYKVKFITRGVSRQNTPMLELTEWKDEDYEDNPPF